MAYLPPALHSLYKHHNQGNTYERKADAAQIKGNYFSPPADKSNNTFYGKKLSYGEENTKSHYREKEVTDAAPKFFEF